jgi:hypothetical protein
MTHLFDEPQLRNSISAFYDAYHQNRVRNPDTWMQQHYWAAFCGNTLEFGGGTLLPRPSADYCTIDLSFEAARRAHQRGIAALVADGVEAPFANQTFDTVACYDVLEHVIRPAAFLAEMCRVTRRRVVIAGPNYVGLHTGGMSRYLPLRLWAYLSGPGKACPQITDPYLHFDEHWLPDRDAIAAPNAGWVAACLQRHSMHIVQLRTWDLDFSCLNALPALRSLGRFMLVVGEKP